MKFKTAKTIVLVIFAVTFVIAGLAAFVFPEIEWLLSLVCIGLLIVAAVFWLVGCKCPRCKKRVLKALLFVNECPHCQKPLY